MSGFIVELVVDDDNVSSNGGLSTFDDDGGSGELEWSSFTRR
jgi:hypothetical protein